MKSLHLITSVVLSALFGAGCHSSSSDPAPAAESAMPDAAEVAGDVPGVTADAATQRGLGVELAEVASVSVSARSQGTATVIDSAAFASSMADLDSLRAEAALASDNAKRLEDLYQDDGNASRQSVDAARQQNSSLQARLTGALARARLDWGDKLTRASDATGTRLRTDITSGVVTLFRAEFPASVGAANALRYELVSSQRAPLALEYLDRSRAVAQFAAGDSILLRLRTAGMPEVSFRPNERLPVVATAQGVARPLVPSAAAIAYQGRMWCYVARSADRFDRVALRTDASSAAGYAADESIKPGDRVVVRGAALLLSLEHSASAEAGASAEE